MVPPAVHPIVHSIVYSTARCSSPFSCQVIQSNEAFLCSEHLYHERSAYTGRGAKHTHKQALGPNQDTETSVILMPPTSPDL